MLSLELFSQIFSIGSSTGLINGDPRWAQVRRLAFFNPMKMSFRFLLLKVPKDEKRGWKWVIIMIGWFYSVSWV